MIRKIILGLILLIIATASFGSITLETYFFGLNGPPLENVKKRLLAKQQTEIVHGSAEEFNLFLKEAPQEIINAMQPFGFFKVKVTSKVVRNGDKWYGTFNIIPGEPIRITSLDLKIFGIGAKEPIFIKFLKDVPVHEGDVLQTEQFRALKQACFDLAFSNGYLSMSIVKNEILIDPKKYTAKVVLYFNTGPHYRIGAITFSSTPFSNKFLRKFLPFKENDFYAAKKIELGQENLSNSNFFQQVSIAPLVENSTDNSVPIEIDLISRKARQYDFGVGFGTDTGPRGRFGMELRHLTSEGHNARAFINASQVQSDLEIHYLIPGRDPVIDQYDISAATETLDQNYGSSRAFKISFGYLTTIFNSWRETFRLNMQQERYNIFNLPRQNSFFMIPSLNLLHTEVDTPLHVTRGHKINVNAQGAKEGLLSSTDFLQLQIDGKYIRSITSSTILVLRGELGLTAISKLLDLPLSMQYFTGGAQSVRGYSFNSLGPGRNLTVASVELRQKIVPNWYFAAFYDVGNASSSFAMDLKHGAGIGVAWMSPVGTIALSYAKALSSHGSPGMIQFSMGPEF